MFDNHETRHTRFEQIKTLGHLKISKNALITLVIELKSCLVGAFLKVTKRNKDLYKEKLCLLTHDISTFNMHNNVIDMRTLSVDGHNSAYI